MPPEKEFDVRGLYDAIDQQRIARGLTWKDVAAEVSERCTRSRPIALPTITGLKEQRRGEGDRSVARRTGRDLHASRRVVV